MNMFVESTDLNSKSSNDTTQIPYLMLEASLSIKLPIRDVLTNIH